MTRWLDCVIRVVRVMRLGVRRGSGLLAMLVALGCATSYVQVEAFATPEEASFRRIALMPFGTAAPLGAPAVPESAAVFVTAKVLEALTVEERFVVIPPAETGRAFELAGGVRDAAAAGRAVHEAFAADAVVSGSVQRFTEREGGKRGSRRPASVRIQLELHDARGVLVFRGIYDETQQSLSANAGSFRIAMDRGFKWLTVEQLATYGSRQLVAHLEDVLE